MSTVSCLTGAAATVGAVYYSTIQDALDHVVDGDVVDVCPGTHHETLLLTTESPNPLYFVGWGAITIAGADDGSTVVDGGNDASNPYGAAVMSDVIDLSLLRLTITGGTGRSSNGGDEPANQYYGGGVNVGYADLFLDDVRIENNIATWGGGIFMGGGCKGGCTVTIQNSQIVNNHLTDPQDVLGVSGAGGGILLAGNTTLVAGSTDWGRKEEDNETEDIAILDSMTSKFSRFDVPDGSDVVCDTASVSCAFK